MHGAHQHQQTALELSQPSLPAPPPPLPPGVRVTKTSIMLGCGETPDEVVQALKTLRCGARCGG